LQPAVTDTNPARIPLVKAEKLYRIFVFPPSFYSIAKVTNPAADGAIIVFIMAIEAAYPSAPTIFRLEPPLKRSHPSQRMSVPRTTCCGLWEAKADSSSFN